MMSDPYDGPKSWPLESEGESGEAKSLVEKIREEIAAVRQRLDDHRRQLKSIGMKKPASSTDAGEEAESGQA